MLTKDAILAALDLTTEVVAVKEWGGDVTVRSMTGLERDAFGASLRDSAGGVDLSNYRAKLLVRCVVGDDGLPLFTEADVIALGGKSSAALDRVCVVAERLNSMAPEALGQAEKN